MLLELDRADERFARDPGVGEGAPDRSRERREHPLSDDPRLTGGRRG